MQTTGRIPDDTEHGGSFHGGGGGGVGEATGGSIYPIL